METLVQVLGSPRRSGARLGPWGQTQREPHNIQRRAMAKARATRTKTKSAMDVERKATLGPTVGTNPRRWKRDLANPRGVDTKAAPKEAKRVRREKEKERPKEKAKERKVEQMWLKKSGKQKPNQTRKKS